MPVDYFDLIYERLLKEIETLMNSAKQVMALPNSHKHSNQDFEQAWKNETQKLKQEMSNVLKG